MLKRNCEQPSNNWRLPTPESELVFSAQPIVEFASRFTPSFLEQLVGAASDGLRRNESHGVSRWRLRVSRMFCLLAVCCHDASSDIQEDLQDGPLQRESRSRKDTDQDDEPHVADARVGDEPLEICPSEGQQPPVQDARHTQGHADARKTE